MINIEIDGESAALDAAVVGGWIPEQFDRRKREGVAPCVRVTIDEPRCHLSLATSACGALGGGGGRPPNSQEQKILELWGEYNLGEPDFAPGNLQAFLRQLSQLF